MYNYEKIFSFVININMQKLLKIIFNRPTYIHFAYMISKLRISNTLKQYFVVIVIYNSYSICI